MLHSVKADSTHEPRHPRAVVTVDGGSHARSREPEHVGDRNTFAESHAAPAVLSYGRTGVFCAEP
jgi:hypothetical protein